MYCIYCGKEISNDSHFCIHCGKQVSKPVNTTANNSKFTISGRLKKGIIIGILSVCLCIALIFILRPDEDIRIKSPEKLLKNSVWYGELDVGNTQYGDSSEYYYWAECVKRVFYSDGMEKATYYNAGDGWNVYGPVPYKMTSEDFPVNLDWAIEEGYYKREWEVLEDDVLKYDGRYYVWDEDKDTHCDCDINDQDDCQHYETWYVTKKYLRIGNDTFTPQKPRALNVDD